MIVAREKILRSVRKVIANKGFYSAGIKKIAEKAGIAQGALYLYFENKEDIYIELLLSLAGKIDEIINYFFSLQKRIYGLHLKGELNKLLYISIAIKTH